MVDRKERKQKREDALMEKNVPCAVLVGIRFRFEPIPFDASGRVGNIEPGMSKAIFVGAGLDGTGEHLRNDVRFVLRGIEQ